MHPRYSPRDARRDLGLRAMKLESRQESLTGEEVNHHDVGEAHVELFWGFTEYERDQAVRTVGGSTPYALGATYRYLSGRFHGASFV